MGFRFTGLWRNPDFLKLWAGGTVSGFGSQITFIALPLTAIGGVLGQTIGLRPTLLLAAGGELAAALFLIPVWSLRHLPEYRDG